MVLRPRGLAPLVLFALSVLFVLQGALLCGRAFAFHVGSTFDAVPGKGGAGGIFYTGAPTERGYTCAACHLSPEGKIRAGLSTTPPGLFENRRYTAGQAYVVTVRLLNEHRGLSSARSNFNGFAAVFLDGKKQHAGRVSGFAPDEYYAAGSALIASAGKTVGTATWSFTWTAPAAGAGPISLYIGMVDGNGADSPPTQTLTDPLGDDVITASLVLSDGSTATLGRGPGPLAPCKSLTWDRASGPTGLLVAIRVSSLGGSHVRTSREPLARTRARRRLAPRLLKRDRRGGSLPRGHLHR